MIRTVVHCATFGLKRGHQADDFQFGRARMEVYSVQAIWLSYDEGFHIVISKVRSMKDTLEPSLNPCNVGRIKVNLRLWGVFSTFRILRLHSGLHASVNPDVMTLLWNVPSLAHIPTKLRLPKSSTILEPELHRHYLENPPEPRQFQLIVDGRQSILEVSLFFRFLGFLGYRQCGGFFLVGFGGRLLRNRLEKTSLR